MRQVGVLLGLILVVTVRGSGTTYLVKTLAGGGSTGTSRGYVDSVGMSALFDEPFGVAVNGSGFVYVGDSGNDKIRLISPSGVVYTIAGGGSIGSCYGNVDGVGTNAFMLSPAGVAVDGSGNVYVADWYNDKIRLISPSNVVSTIAGHERGEEDGVGTNAKFEYPAYVAVNGSGFVYVSDMYSNRIRLISPSGDYCGKWISGDGTNAFIFGGVAYKPITMRLMVQQSWAIGLAVGDGSVVGVGGKERDGPRVCRRRAVVPFLSPYWYPCRLLLPRLKVEPEWRELRGKGDGPSWPALPAGPAAMARPPA
jgi:NHL repeat